MVKGEKTAFHRQQLFDQICRIFRHVGIMVGQLVINRIQTYTTVSAKMGNQHPCRFVGEDQCIGIGGVVAQVDQYVEVIFGDHLGGLPRGQRVQINEFITDRDKLRGECICLARQGIQIQLKLAAIMARQHFDHKLAHHMYAKIRRQIANAQF